MCVAASPWTPDELQRECETSEVRRCELPPCVHDRPSNTDLTNRTFRRAGTASEETLAVRQDPQGRAVNLVESGECACYAQVIAAQTTEADCNHLTSIVLSGQSEVVHYESQEGDNCGTWFC